MSGMFKSKKVTPEIINGSQEDRIQSLWGTMQSGLKDAQEGKSGYKGDLVAGLTDMENQNLATLSSYLNSPYASQSDLFKTSKKAVTDLIGQDPWAKGGAIDYTQNRLKRYLTEELLPTTAREASASGGLYSSGFIRSQQDQVDKTMSDLTQYAYGYEADMNRLKASLIPQANSMAQFETDEPLSRINNTMGLAGYKRTQYDNPLLAAKYADYNQQLQTYLMGSLNLANTNGQTLAMPQYRPSAFSQYVMPVIQGGMDIAAAGAAAGSDERLKENISFTGLIFKGLKVYTWTWKKLAKQIFDTSHNIGVMAQEVLTERPEAIVHTPSGFMMVDYSKL